MAVMAAEYGEHTSPVAPSGPPQQNVSRGDWQMYDPETATVEIVNDTDVSNESVYASLVGPHPEVAQMMKWVTTTHGDVGRGRVGNLFQRDRYVTPERLFDQFRVAYDAAESDDIVSGVLDTTEALMFNRMNMYAEDEDQENIWNQIAFDLDLESRYREMARELFICTDETTEILTRRGWMRHDQIIEGVDEVLCLDPDTNAITWQTLQRVNRFEFHGEMHHWQTSRFDALTTPDHRWLTETRSGVRSFKTTAEIDASQRSFVVLGGGEPLAFAAQPTVADEFVELIGWVVTEGHYQHHPKYGVSGVIVAQSREVNPEYCDRIAALVKHYADQGATATEYCYGQSSQFYFGKGVADLVRAWSPQKQITPAFLSVLTTTQAELLYETLMAGDGHTESGSHRWAQKDAGRIGGFQMLCAMLGLRSREAVGAKASQVSVYQTAPAQSQCFETTMVRHDGMVWCPTTPTGTWMARRNGTTYWTGNCSQFYSVTWWGRKSYRVRGKNLSTGVQRRKNFDNLVVPLGISILDPTKVVPVGNLMFNQDQLAYIADRTEVDMLDAAVMNDPAADPVSKQIIMGKYAPPDMERRNLAKQGINADWLYILNPRNVWRHTLTRSQYERFAKVRMKSVFELLDLKQQLRQMDRAHLIGGTNFIVLIRKGSDLLPAKPEEVASLKGQVTTVARMPILVGDHRLSVDIVTPKLDVTLNEDKYATLDLRISARLYGMLMTPGKSGARTDDSVKVAKVIARNLESRRDGLRRVMERQVFRPCVNANDALDDAPDLRFHPKTIDLALDASVMAFLQDARDRGDLSRDSYLSAQDFDQQDEFNKRKREARDYDDTFTLTNVPFSAPGPGHAVPVGPDGKPNEEPAGTSTNAPATPPVPPHAHDATGAPVALPKPATPTPGRGGASQNPRSAGRTQGGTRNGGGAAPGSGQGKAPVRGRPKSS